MLHRSTPLLVSLVSSSYTGFGSKSQSTAMSSCVNPDPSLTATEKHTRKQTSLPPSQHESVTKSTACPFPCPDVYTFFFFESHWIPTDFSYINHNKDMPMPHAAACTARENKLLVLSTSARSCATRGVSVVMNFVRSIIRMTRALLVVIALPTTTK